MKDINNYNYVYNNYDVTIIVKDKIVTYINKRINVFERLYLPLQFLPLFCECGKNVSQ